MRKQLRDFISTASVKCSDEVSAAAVCCQRVDFHRGKMWKFIIIRSFTLRTVSRSGNYSYSYSCFCLSFWNMFYVWGLVLMLIAATSVCRGRRTLHWLAPWSLLLKGALHKSTARPCLSLRWYRCNTVLIFWTCFFTFCWQVTTFQEKLKLFWNTGVCTQNSCSFRLLG